MLYGLPWWLSNKESACSAGDLGLIPGWGNALKEGMANHPVLLPRESHGQRIWECGNP